MKKVLLTNHFLREFTGAEVAIYDLAKFFKGMGCDVIVGAYYFDNPLLEHFKDLSIGLVQLNDVQAGQHFDLIWAHHFTTLDYVLIDKEITASKVVFSTLSPTEILETPPLSFKSVDVFLANSMETQSALKKLGLKKSLVFPNPVDAGFFECDLKKAGDLNTIAVISNHCSPEILQAMKQIEGHGVEVVFFGRGFNFELLTPQRLVEFDAAISIGRTVQYCLALGVPIYCYDHHGGPGWINKQNLSKAAYYNFSGRCTPIHKPSDMIFAELIELFAETTNLKEFYRSFAQDHYYLKKEVMKALDVESNQGAKNGSNLALNIALRHRRFYSEIEAKSHSALYVKRFSDELHISRQLISDSRLVITRKFKISRLKGIEDLYFCPINDFCIVQVVSVKLINRGNNSVELGIKRANARYVFSDSYYFDTTEPLFYFEISPESINEESYEVEASFILIEIGKLALKRILLNLDEKVFSL